MTACLDEYTLFRLFEGEGSTDERAHKDECDACGRRYQRLAGDVDLLARTVREGPPPLAARRPVLAGYGWWIPALTVVAVELAVVLWTGRPPAPPAGQTASASVDVTPSHDEVSTALFSASDDDDSGVDDAWLNE